jgi:uncharacterized membrane protein
MILKYLAAYIFTGLAFALIDSIWLRNAYTKLYQPEIGDMLMKDGFRVGPAIAFYMLYIIGMIIFAVVPAMASGRWQTALIQGAMLGFFCYMTYDLTNMVTLKHWSMKVVILDIIWGTFLTGSASASGYLVTNAIFGRS